MATGVIYADDPRLEKSVASVTLLRHDQWSASGQGSGAYVLLLKRSMAARAYPGHYHTPGGGVEQGETRPAAARREMAEEVGVAVGAMELAASIWLAERVVFLYVSTDFTGEPYGKEAGTDVAC